MHIALVVQKVVSWNRARSRGESTDAALPYSVFAGSEWSPQPSDFEE
jgi:hypothetical protein